jgi:hypothetical protein
MPMKQYSALIVLSVLKTYLIVIQIIHCSHKKQFVAKLPKDPTVTQDMSSDVKH